MLDGRPINEIGGVERPRSVRSVKGSRFGEHFQAVEMEDTSSVSHPEPRLTDMNSNQRYNSSMPRVPHKASNVRRHHHLSVKTPQS